MGPIKLILGDAVQSDGNWNLQKLKLIAIHPKLFFDFGAILYIAGYLTDSSNQSMIQILDFCAEHRLIDWDEMLPFLVQEALCHHVRVQIENKWKQQRDQRSELIRGRINAHKPDSYRKVQDVHHRKDEHCCQCNIL